MSEPTTEAGRLLLADHLYARLRLRLGEEATDILQGQFAERILAIEAEARADALREDVLVRALRANSPWRDDNSFAAELAEEAVAIAREYRAILAAEKTL